MRLSFSQFPNAIPMTYLCPPMIFALNCARCGHPPPLNLPDEKIPLQVWVEIPEIPVGAIHELPREEWVIDAAAWIVEHCEEVESEIRRALITPLFLN